MQARRLRRQRRRRSNMSNKPVNPWNELEGRFFKVDVGSTTAEAITNDHNTGEPVVHYTTDGDIVFNGMKFCKQKKDAVSSDKRIVVHKAIPMFPRKGHIYCFQGQYIFFKIYLYRLEDTVTYNIPKFIDSVVPTCKGMGHGGYPNVGSNYNIEEITNCRGTSVTGKFLKEMASKYYEGSEISLLFRVHIGNQGLRKKRDEAIYVHILEECDFDGVLNRFPPDCTSLNDCSYVAIKSEQEIKSLGYKITSPYYRLSDECKTHYKYGTFEDFKAAAERGQGVNARIYRMRRCKHRYKEKKEDGSIYFIDLGKKEYVLKKKRLFKGIVFYRDGGFYGSNKNGSERDLDLRNYLIQYTKEKERNGKNKMTYTRNLIKAFYIKSRRKE